MAAPLPADSSARAYSGKAPDSFIVRNSKAVSRDTDFTVMPESPTGRSTP